MRLDEREKQDNIRETGSCASLVGIATQAEVVGGETQNNN